MEKFACYFASCWGQFKPFDIICTFPKTHNRLFFRKSGNSRLKISQQFSHFSPLKNAFERERHQHPHLQSIFNYKAYVIIILWRNTTPNFKVGFLSAMSKVMTCTCISWNYSEWNTCIIKKPLNTFLNCFSD